MVATKPIPIKSRREIGTLARKRAIKKLIEDAEAAAAQTTPLILQAMEKLDGFTYPIMGAQLMLAGPKYVLSREFHAADKQFTAKVLLTLNKNGGK